MFRALSCLLAIFIPGFAAAAEPDASSLVSAIEYEIPKHSVDADDGVLLGVDECEDLLERTRDVIFTYRLTVDPTEKEGSQKRLTDVWLYELGPSAAEIECDSSTCIPLDDEVQTTSNSVRVALDPQSVLQGRACENSRDIFVRIDLVRDFEDEDDTTSAEARVRIDVDGPEATEITGAEATENFIEVQFEGDVEDAERWLIGWGSADSVAESSGALTILGSVNDDATKASFDDVSLPVGQLIHVYVWAEDEAGNSGALSEPWLVEPLETIDYWEAYGSRDAACSTGTGTASWLPALVLLGLFIRRRRTGAPPSPGAPPFPGAPPSPGAPTSSSAIASARTFVVVALISLAPATASAEDGFFDVRLGGYSPGIAATPGFSSYFGNDSRWMVGLDGGWIFANTAVADAGVEAGVSYTSFSGNAFTEEGQRFEDGSSLTVVPMRIGLRAYSGDWSGWLVASARFGLTGHYFQFGNPGGVSVASDGSVGEGVQWGWYGTGQLGVDLAGFDRTSAASMESNWSVLKTLLFVEFTYSAVDDFGTSNLDLGDARLAVGLGFVF